MTEPAKGMSETAKDTVEGLLERAQHLLSAVLHRSAADTYDRDRVTEAFGDITKALAALRSEPQREPANIPKPTPPNGAWKPGLPMVDDLPILAWIGWWMQSHSIYEEDAVAAALVALAGIASGKKPDDSDYLAYVVEHAARQHVVEAIHRAPEPTGKKERASEVSGAVRQSASDGQESATPGKIAEPPTFMETIREALAAPSTDKEGGR